jgi:transcriptional regulator with XRE-family HTH domain
MKKKIEKNINEELFFKQALNSIPEEVKQSVSLSMAIASQINSILKRKNITQRDLANLLGKKESEISKWLSGNHNFTTNTIGKIQSVLGEEIISVPIYAKKQIKFIPVQSFNQSFQSTDFQQPLSDPAYIEEESSIYNMIINYNADCHATKSFS